MKRLASLITASALAFQTTGLALASTIPKEVRRKCSAGILPAPDHDDADRMIEMVDGAGTTTWDYWDDGQVKEMASPQGTMLYDYYATTGRLEELTEVISGGTNIVTTYTYDDNGRTETVDKFGETTTFEYDEASRPEKMIYDTGAYALYTYDGRSRIKAVEHKNSSHTLLRKETNTYDPASRITSRYEGPASGGVTTTFTYDDVGQLTGESSSGYSASYTYDANGNRTNRTVNGVSETYTVDDSDKLTSVTWSQGGNNYAKEYAYHWSGRVTGITYKTNGTPTSSETLTWNKENRLISRGSDTYTYNGLNTRVAKTDGGGSFTYKRAGAHQTAPVLHDGAANYLPGISEKRSGTSTFLHSGIKNAQLQTNSSQSNTATKCYDAFGNVLANTGTWKGPFGYGGKFGYQSDDVDTQLLGDRYYDPTIGRFLSRDQVKDGRNWYCYGSKSPVSHGDPTGLTIVDLRWYLVRGTFNYHTYIAVVDERTGLVFEIHGNPERFGLESLTNPGKIVMTTRFASPTNPSHPETEFAGRIRLRNDHLNDFDRTRYFYQSLGKKLEAAKVDYRLGGPNSNSFARKLAMVSGLKPPESLPVNTRGWADDPWPGIPTTKRAIGPRSAINGHW